jgi:hypothetical protein
VLRREVGLEESSRCREEKSAMRREGGVEGRRRVNFGDRVQRRREKHGLPEEENDTGSRGRV